MANSFPFLLTSLMYLAFINTKQETKIKAPILWTADWSPDNKNIVVGGNDGLLRIYQAASFKLSKTYKLATAIQCLDWNQNGKILAIALDDNPVQLLNIETGQFFKLQETTGSRALS